MADRYLISATGTNLPAYWSATSGGPGGASVPTLSDNAILDANTPAGAKVLGAALVCKDFNYSAYTAGGGIVRLDNTVTVYGHLRGNGTALGGGGYFFTMAATDTNGGLGYDIDLGPGGTFPNGTATTFALNGVGGRWEMRAALVGSNLTVLRQAGTFNTNDYAITCVSMQSNGSLARGGSAGASLVTCSSTNTSFSFSGSNDTWDCTNASVNFRGTANAPQWGSIRFKDYLADGIGNVHLGILPAGTVNKVQRLPSGAVQTDGLLIANDIVVNEFRAVGNANPNFITIRSGTDGVTRTITAGLTEVDNCHFRDIAAAGAGAWTSSGTGSGTNLLSDQQGCSGITFTPSQVLTRDATAGLWGTLARWVKVSGPGSVRIPIAQDDVNLGAGVGQVTGTDVFCLGRDIDLTGYTPIFARTSSATPYMVFGSWTQPNYINWGAAAVNTLNFEFRGRDNCTITSGGKAVMPGSTNMNQYVYSSGSGGYTMLDGFSCIRTDNLTAATFTIVSGTVDWGTGLTHILGTLGSTGTATRTIECRNSRFILPNTTANTIINFSGSNFTINAAQATFEITNSSGLTRTISSVAGIVLGTVKYNLPDSPGALGTTGTVVIDNLDITDGTAISIQANSLLTVLGDLHEPLGRQFGYQSIAQSDSSNLLQAPHSASLDIQNDITIDVKFTWLSATRQMLLSKLNAGLNAGYGIRFEATGVPTFFGGATQTTASAAVPYSVGDTFWLRLQRNKTTGVVQWFTSANGTAWTQLGANVPHGAANSGLGTNTDILYVASRASANDMMALGRIHEVNVYGNLTATASGSGASWSFSAKPVGDDTVADGQGNGNALAIPLNLRAGDGRLALRSGTAGTTAWFDPAGKPPKCQQVYSQDISCATPDKLYVQGNTGVGVNVKTGTFPAGAPYIRQWEQQQGSAPVAFKSLPKAGNKLLAMVSLSGNAPTWVTPAGWTDVTNGQAPGAGLAGIRLYERISDGTEATFTSASSGGTMSIYIVEFGDMGGSPGYQIGKNVSGGSVNNMSLASPAPATSKLSYAVGGMSGNGSFGNLTNITDGFGELRTNTTPTLHRMVGKLIPAPGATADPAVTWTSNRNAAGIVAILEQNLMTFFPQAIVV